MVVLKDSAYSAVNNPFSEKNKSSLSSFCFRCAYYLGCCMLILIVILNIAEAISREFDKVEDGLNSTRYELRQQQTKGLTLAKEKENLVQSVETTKKERDDLKQKLEVAKQHVIDLTSQLEHLKGDLGGGRRNLLEETALN